MGMEEAGVVMAESAAVRGRHHCLLVGRVPVRVLWPVATPVAPPSTLVRCADGAALLRISMLRNRVHSPAADWAAFWASSRPSLYLGGPEDVSRSCGVLWDATTQTPLSLGQVRNAVNAARADRPKDAPPPPGLAASRCHLEYLVINVRDCPACVLATCVALRPSTTVLLCDPVPCATGHAFIAGPARHEPWTATSVIVAPRNALAPIYCLDADDVRFILRTANAYRDASVSFANFELRLFDATITTTTAAAEPDATPVPTLAPRAHTARTFRAWCASVLVPQRVLSKSPGRKLPPLTILEAKCHQLRLAARVECPATIIMGDGSNYRHPPPPHPASAACRICADHVSYLDLSDALAVWIGTVRVSSPSSTPSSNNQ